MVYSCSVITILFTVGAVSSVLAAPVGVPGTGGEVTTTGPGMGEPDTINTGAGTDMGPPAQNSTSTTGPTTASTLITAPAPASVPPTSSSPTVKAGEAKVEAPAHRNPGNANTKSGGDLSLLVIDLKSDEPPHPHPHHVPGSGKFRFGHAIPPRPHHSHLQEELEFDDDSFEHSEHFDMEFDADMEGEDPLMMMPPPIPEPQFGLGIDRDDPPFGDLEMGEGCPHHQHPQEEDILIIPLDKTKSNGEGKPGVESGGKPAGVPFPGAPGSAPKPEGVESSVNGTKPESVENSVNGTKSESFEGSVNGTKSESAEGSAKSEGVTKSITSEGTGDASSTPPAPPAPPAPPVPKVERRRSRIARAAYGMDLD